MDYCGGDEGICLLKLHGFSLTLPTLSSCVCLEFLLYPILLSHWLKHLFSLTNKSSSYTHRRKSHTRYMSVKFSHVISTFQNQELKCWALITPGKKSNGSDPKVIPQPGAGGVREAWNVKCLNHCKIII